MRLLEFAVRDWRNLACAELPDLGPLTVLWGPNGAGKTSLLEALAVLCTWKGLRPVPWVQVIRRGQGQASVHGLAESQLGRCRLGVQLCAPEGQEAQRLARLDGEPARDADAWFRRLRAVTFTPDDVQIVRGSPELRRRFLDRAAFNAWPEHLDRVRVFRRALAQKAALLRSSRLRAAELDAWDEQLVGAGSAVVIGRRRLVRSLAAPLAELHEELSGGGEVRLRLRSALLEREEDEQEAAIAARYRVLLQAQRSEEVRRGLNLQGPQRDELDLEIAAPGAQPLPARSHASQGQVRSLALALKLAELSVAGAEGDPPLLLVDDLSSELDGERLGRLVARVAQSGSQALVTTTDPEPVMRRSKVAFKAIEIRRGAVAGGTSAG